MSVIQQIARTNNRVHNEHLTAIENYIQAKEEIQNQMWKQQVENELMKLRREMDASKVILKQQIEADLIPKIQEKSAKVNVDEKSLSNAMNKIKSAINTLFK